MATKSKTPRPVDKTKGGLKPNGWTDKPKTRSRLKVRSRSYASRMTVYRARVRIFLKSHPFCAVFPKLAATSCHHAYGRVGKLLLWKPGFRSVSFAGHRWIEEHKNEARRRHLLGPVGSWNDYGKAVKAEKANGGNCLDAQAACA